MTFYLFHGTGSTPRSNWLPWLRDALEARGHRVIVPAFPTPDGQTVAEWMTVLSQYPPPDQQSVLIGHSAGATFALRVLERVTTPVRGAVLVAGVTDVMGNDFDPLLADFLAGGFDWPAIRQNGGELHVFHSSDDPYVPLRQAETMVAHTAAVAHFVATAGHFSSSSGYREFPELLELCVRLAA